ncbi:phosphoribosylamine--glycine ligase-like, partial [Saccoglossus kowalevskii]|uniref:Trifunctional purine biosynthetic protein adenosine-3-like n=1 Tax=Saccoglossus kowalevskii TaxID=10224 RepID=A0ABM0MX53_SACKO
MAKNVMIIGGGGREHALADSLSRSSSIDRIWCVPGNAGTAEMPRCRNIPLNHRSDITELARLKRVNLVIPGPEAPLAAGIVDDLNRAGIPAFGPTRFSARLEASKGFAKDFMTRNGVSTGSYKRFTNPHEAKAELGRFGFPVVVKADGLAAGKGVLICQDDQE